MVLYFSNLGFGKSAEDVINQRVFMLLKSSILDESVLTKAETEIEEILKSGIKIKSKRRVKKSEVRDTEDLKLPVVNRNKVLFDSSLNSHRKFTTNIQIIKR